MSIEREGLQRMARVVGGTCNEPNCGRPAGFFHSVECPKDPSAIERAEADAVALIEARSQLHDRMRQLRAAKLTKRRAQYPAASHVG